jgi:hypothetical protein
MLGFKSFWAACCTIAGIEVMHAIHMRQLVTLESRPQTPAEQFYVLVVKVTNSENFARLQLIAATEPEKVKSASSWQDER